MLVSRWMGKRMKTKQRTVSFFIISLLALSVVSLGPIRLDTVKAQPNASLIGIISDKGVDTNGNGLYDYLNVTIGVYVTEAGYFTVEAYWLENAQNSSLYINAYTSGFLNVGSAQLNLSFYGPTINHARFNPDSVGDLILTGNNTYDEIYYARLSRTFSYSEFDVRAVLTGIKYSEGVDTNGDGLFNYLQIGVQVNVTDPQTYEVSIQLFGNFSIWNSSMAFLSPGQQVMNVSLNGPMIRASKMSFSSVYYISLQDSVMGAQLDYRYFAQLNRTYAYTQFQTLAYFTGITRDRGVSNPGDSKFDYLEVDVQINFTQAGYYEISASGLYENLTSGYIGLSNYTDSNFAVGLQFVNFTFPSSPIYASRANPAFIQNIQIYTSIGYYWMNIDQLTNVPLSRTYHYNEFNPHAYLTGRVYDKGVDTDHDGLFDYLKISIEVNVTEAGTYLVRVDGLAGTASSQIWDYQYSGPFNLNIGVHLFNITFYGPEIAYYEVNPINVTYVYLEEVPNIWSYNGQSLDSIVSAPLLTPYTFSQFDHPSNDMQLNFTVYPDGHVGINAVGNYTHMYPENVQGPVVNASARLSKTNNLILGSVNGTVGLPPNVTVPWPYPYDQAQFPTNQTAADYLSHYNNGILTEKLNATSLFPSIVKTQYPYNTTDFALSGTYLDGMMHAQLSGSSVIPQEVASQLPFNVTDVTVKADLGSSNEFKGNITLHMISGLPTGDVIVNFKGNRSDMLFTGYINVLYGTYGGTVVNKTNVATLISEIQHNVTGVGPSSLYNMTDGTLELTSVEVTNSTISGGVTIDYNASVRGDFAALIAKYINAAYFPYTFNDQYYPIIYTALNSTLSSVEDMSFTMAYTHADSVASIAVSFDSNVKTLWSYALKLIPPTIPSNIPENETNEINAWLKLGNATAYAVQNASIYVAYSGSEPQPSLILNATLVANAAQINNETIKLMPDLLSYVYSASPQELNIIEAYLNTTYATLYSSNTTAHLQNGIANFKTNFAYQGNLDEQINAAKSYYINLINYEYSLMSETPPAQLSFLNQTSIDINNLGINLQYGKDNAFLNVTGIILSPPIQTIGTSGAFKLTNFFNATSLLGSNEPPTKYEKLRITVSAGTNTTYTVLLSRPLSVPKPDSVSRDLKSMTWENTTISSLKDLTFNLTLSQGVFEHNGVTYYVPLSSNSTIRNFSFNYNATYGAINITASGPPGTSGFCNVTIPRALLDVNVYPDQWTIIIDGKIATTNCTITRSTNGEYTFIYIPYTHSTHPITIEGTKPFPEMPQNILPQILIVATLIATLLLIATRRKRIARSLRSKSQIVTSRMTNWLFHHPQE